MVYGHLGLPFIPGSQEGSVEGVVGGLVGGWPTMQYHLHAVLAETLTFTSECREYCCRTCPT